MEFESFYDKDGNPRHNVRVRWFDGEAKTFQEAFLGPEKAPEARTENSRVGSVIQPAYRVYGCAVSSIDARAAVNSA